MDFIFRSGNHIHIIELDFTPETSFVKGFYQIRYNFPMGTISPVTRSHAEAERNYTRLSRWYDRIEGGWEDTPRRLGLAMLAPQPGETLLEIGCGTGASLAELPAGVVTVGLDLSHGMLAQTRTRLVKAGRTADLLQADALHLPFPGACFTTVLMSFVLELMDTPEIPVVLGEVRRVLRPGGRVGVTATSRMGGKRLMLNLYEWAHRSFPAAVDCRPIFARHALEESGFAIQQAHLLSRTGLGIEVLTAIPLRGSDE